ncbi:antitoxin Xre/MbcA/ParS toxin-binding domain-containing protein [Sphingomonas hankookensis]|uniref:antitoxin Xre/MbcA/ParS toxin-binding domain-containing protein n=1 Tax=Sphingomonas hankookensis TaxID=563996 RepID=UPI001F5618A7|nr:antitoxin Xre/MbcA/ParS toxin-binding domain-containing protein [Sphingomonas hankookensis]
MSALAEQTAPEMLPEMLDAPVDAAPAAPVDAAPADATPAEPAPRPGAMKFRRKYTTVRLTPEQASRQGQVATSAFRRFGERDAAVAFLNAHDEALGGRPLDLAIASAEGLAQVEAAMAERTA